MSVCHAYRRDNQGPFILSRFIRTGAEERVDAFGKRVGESVDEDFGINVIERHLQPRESRAFKNKMVVI